MNWVPRTVDVRKMGAPIGGAEKDNFGNGNRGDSMPKELMMTDTNIMAMRVPNFSYAGDLNFFRQH